MANLVLSPLAERDLDEILEFIARDKPDAAVEWVLKIRNTCRLLAEQPEIGELRPDLRGTHVRSSVVGNYVIFYRSVPNGIEVARVIRGERDIRDLTI